MSSRELLSTELPAGIHQASRADQRVVRQILANLVEDGCSREVGRIAAGPLSKIIRFLAGCRLTFVFIAWDEQKRLHAFGSPSVESVSSLVNDLLSYCPSSQFNGFQVAAANEDLPSCSVRMQLIESAVEQIIDGLHERDLSFILGWESPSNRGIQLDRSMGADREKVAYYLHWFLRERLGTSALVNDVDQKQAIPAVEINAT